MKTAIILILENLVAMIVGPKMIIWLLGVAAKRTDNKIDDHVIKIVKAGYENDMVSMKKGVEDLVGTL